MVQEVEAFGKILEFPDGMSQVDMAKHIRNNEHKLNPDFKQPEGFSGIAKNVLTGAKQTGRMTGATIDAARNNLSGVEDYAKDSAISAEQNMPIEQRKLQGELSSIDRDQGAIGQIGDTLKAAGRNPMGTAQMVAEQLPNSAVSLAGGYAGFKTGALAGSPFGPVGATIGGTLGFLSGMFLGNVLLESGSKAIEKASDADGFTPQDRDEALREGAVKGAVITGVDAATFKLGGVLAKRFGGEGIKAGARAEAKVLMDAGVDTTSIAAINAALKTSPELFKSARVAGERAAIQSMSTKSKTAILGGGMAMETVGEGVGEYAGEFAATGKGDVVDATIEALSSATMSVAETAYNFNKLKSGNNLDPKGIRKVTDGINAHNLKEGIDSIQKSGSVDEAIAAASNVVSQKPTTKDDVLRSVDPGLADIERLTGMKPSESVDQAINEAQQGLNVDPISSQANTKNILSAANVEGQISQSLEGNINEERINEKTEEVISSRGNNSQSISAAAVKENASRENFKSGGFSSENGKVDGGLPQTNVLGHDSEIVLPDGATLPLSFGKTGGSEGKGNSAGGYIESMSNIGISKTGFSQGNNSGVVEPSNLSNNIDPFKSLPDSDITNTGSFVNGGNSHTRVPQSNKIIGNDIFSDHSGKKDIILSQNSRDSGLAVTKRIGDIKNSKAFIDQGFDGLNGDEKRLVVDSMVTIGHDDKVLNAIVQLVPVNVMDMLSSKKITPKMLFHNPSMFLDANSIINGDKPVSRTDVTGAFIKATALAAAKIPTGLNNFNSVRGSVDSNSTVGTIDDRHGVTPISSAVTGAQDVDASSVPNIIPNKNNKQQEVDEESGERKQLKKVQNWVIREKATGKVLFETSDKNKVDALNTKKYEAVHIYDHQIELNDLNSKVRKYAERPNQYKEESQPKFSRTPEERLKDRERSKQLEKGLVGKGFNFTITSRDVRDFAANDRSKENEADTAEKIAKIFGKRIVWIEAKGDFKINGVVIPSIKDTIFIDVTTDKYTHAVMGHELSHHMEHDVPLVYKDMVKSLETVIKNHKGYADKYGVEGADKAYIIKEIVGDIMGDNFTKPEFWNRVAEANPSAFKSISDTIIKWLKNLILKAKSRSLGSEQWVTDAQKAQDIIAKAVAQYAVDSKSDGTEGGAKFSKAAAENTLIAQHNLSAKNLIHVDRMGGLAAPSIAITDKNHPLKGFGEITLLSDKDLVDPKQGAKAYGSDIYSPRYPQLSYDFSGKAIKKLNEILSDGVEKTGDREFYNDSLEDDPFRELTHSSAAMYQFLKEQGADPKLAFTKPKELPNESFRPFADSNMDSFDLSKDEKFREAVKEHFAQISDREKINDDALSNLARSYAHDVISYKDAKKNIGKVDRQATNSALFRQITDSGLRNKFDEYLVSIVDRSGPKERIFQGYTNSGNRRYIPHDIDNVIKILKKDLRGGENFKYGLGSIRAKYSPQFKSIEQIRKNKDRLMDSDTFDLVKKEVQTELDSLNESLSSYGTFSGYDNVETMLSDTAKMGISRALKENGFENVPDSIKLDIQKFLGKLQAMPTEYFEVKLLRSVRLGEFTAAVIPDDSTQQVKDILNRNGINDIREYKSGDNQDRIDKINQVDRVMFSRATKDIPETININGVERPTTNSEGNPIPNPEKFYRWFGESKMVDDQGRPIVYSHSTKERFTEFKESYGGIYLTTGESVAEDIFNPDGEGVTHQVYIKSENPFTAVWKKMSESDKKVLKEVMDTLFDESDVQELRDIDTANSGRESDIDHFDVFTDGEFYLMLGRNNQDKVLNLLKEHGYDSIEFSDSLTWGESNISTVVFDPSRIIIIDDGDQLTSEPKFSKAQKSILNEDSGSTLAKNATVEGVSPERTKTLGIPGESTFRKAQRLTQDSFNRFTVIKDWLSDRGINISAQADVYSAEERYHSKVANQLEDFREKHRNPLIEKISKAGFTMADISDYLEAQHAPEANAAIQKLQNNPDATAYGITDKEAKEYLDTARPGLKELANEVRSITDQTKKLRLDNGLLNKDITDAWDAAYKHYIPVKGGADDGAQVGTGKGLKVNFKSKRRLGHGKRDEAVIENILLDHERAIMEVERNRVGKHVVMMAAEIAMPELMTIGQPEKRKVLRNTTAYEVQVKGITRAVFDSMDGARAYKQLLPSADKKVTAGDITINPTQDQRIVSMASPMLAENEINIYMDGHAIRVQINDELMARAYTKMGIEGYGNAVAAGRALNGYLSKVYTGYNPEFILTNMVRDFTSGFINLTGEQGIKMATKAIANYPANFAALLKYAATNGKSSNKWIDAYRANGGNTGAAYLSDMDRLGTEVATEFASYQGVIANVKQGDSANAMRAAARKVFNVTLKWIYNLNQAGENAMRLSAFKAMIDSGRTVNEAAKAAKNITVNFNRKGEAAWMNAYQLFFNASVQGVSAMNHALFKGKHKYQAWALANSMVALGYMAAAAFGGGDEDEYEKVDDSTKERNLLIKSGDGYVKIPVPYGYGFFFNLGRMMPEVQKNDEWGTLPFRLGALAIEELTPLGNIVNASDGEFRMDQVVPGLLPTAAQIPVQLAFNKQLFSGTAIMPDSPSDPFKPERDRMWRGTQGTMYDQVAGWLETGLGPNLSFDVSPESIKFLTRTFTGGAGAFADSTVSAAMLAKEGAQLETREIPFVRKAYTELTIREHRAAYYKAEEEALKAAKEFERAKNNNDLVSMQTLLRDKHEMISLHKFANSMQKFITLSRDQQDSVRLSDTLTVAEKRLKLKDLEKNEEAIYNQYLEVFKVKKEEMKKRN